MTRILITSHGKLAEGLLHAAKMLIGNMENVDYITFEDNMGLEELKDEVAEYLNNINEPLLVFTDMRGGTPFNVVTLLTQHMDDVFIFYGANLPMVVEACLLKDSLDLKDLAEKIYSNINEGIGIN